jgi:hypothetical protein
MLIIVGGCIVADESFCDNIRLSGEVNINRNQPGIYNPASCTAIIPDYPGSAEENHPGRTY